MACRIERAALLATAASLLIARGAQADDPQVELMAEPAAYTDVADAFDEGDPFDVNVRLGFVWTSDSATIQREHTDAATADGRPSRRFIDVAEHQHERNALDIDLELGLYRDLMLFAAFPVVLAETRELREPAGLDCQDDPSLEACLRLTAPLPDGTREPLFELGLVSAKRSGVPSFDLGVAWGVLNQQRGSLLSTWVLRAALTVPTGDVLAPCIRGGEACDPGISDGQGHLTLESRWSHRFRHLEPLLGIAHAFSWFADDGMLYRPAGDLEGTPDDAPPTISTLTAGAVVIPWEDRGRHQQFSLDTRMTASFVSEGRDVSPLFDALGASSSAHLRAPNFAEVGVVGAEQVDFMGITRVESHARISMRTALVIQAARYVRFNLGMGLTHTTAHLLTGEPRCNIEVDVAPTDLRAGACVRGLPNPNHRPAIDAPGERFRIGSQLGVDLFASAAGQF